MHILSKLIIITNNNIRYNYSLMLRKWIKLIESWSKNKNQPSNYHI